MHVNCITNDAETVVRCIYWPIFTGILIHSKLHVLLLTVVRFIKESSLCRGLVTDFNFVACFFQTIAAFSTLRYSYIQILKHSVLCICS